ncbi:MAG: UvrD-helicase domain-containing protein [bacterium]
MEPLKSTVVFAPAGSGKTEELSQRYLKLIANGVKPERILTLTFTDRAAAEMKERILTNARKHSEELYQLLRENILKLRISTIHSFCLSLVQRFADLLGIDPNPEVLADDSGLWQQAKYDALMKIAENQYGEEIRSLLISLLGDRHRQNWRSISTLIDKLFANRTAVLRAGIESEKFVWIETDRVKELARELSKNRLTAELISNYQQLFSRNYEDEQEIGRITRLLEQNPGQFMTSDGEPRKIKNNEELQHWAELMCDYRNQIKIIHNLMQFRRHFLLFKNCFLDTYEQLKREQGLVDYEDMELLALKLLSENPDWLNILYIFDEHTDHILVDEFQDTSFLQWAIIDKLSEEWRSGAGIKTELGITPTVFIVGDDKQSIYMFRDARVEVFTLARDKLRAWLGDEELEIKNLQNNYRSLPAIIDFNNTLFSGLMNARPDAPPWCTRYRHFIARRQNPDPGRVELLIDRVDRELNAAEARELDAANVARRIRLLIDSGYPVYDRQPDKTEIRRACRFNDIAILIRARGGLLPALEQQLRKYHIPFLVVGGTGFYDEPEVRYLSYLTRFLVDPADDMALYITLRGPLFQIDEKELLLSTRRTGFPTWWGRLREAGATGSERLANALMVLDDALKRVNYEPLHLILNRLLVQTRAWQTFWEPQREANIRKFLQRIQELELSGKQSLRIRTFLDQPGSEEAKADVPAEEMNAVQIMTVHAAKGLEFPIVFHPGLHEKILGQQSERLLVEETAINQVQLLYIEDAKLRKKFTPYLKYEEKQVEEEKRIFYVACTRARDALFLTGIWHKKLPSRTKFEWLKEQLGLRLEDNGFTLQTKITGVMCVLPSELPEVKSPVRTAAEEKAVVIKKNPIPSVAKPPIRPIVRFLPRELRNNPPAALGIGEIVHRLLELLSRGRLEPEPAAIEQAISRQLRLRGFPQHLHPELQPELKNQFHRLINSPVWEIIRPQPNSFAELPVMFNDGTTIFTGRIDRLIVKPDTALIYDYKTFPVKRSELERLTAEYYQSQLKYYAAAVQELFPDKRVRTFVVYTPTAAVVPADA